jgi:hypothetical protein
MPRRPFSAPVTRIYEPDKPDEEKQRDINRILLKHRDSILKEDSNTGKDQADQAS